MMLDTWDEVGDIEQKMNSAPCCVGKGKRR
jgi:hypothetical protein